MAIHDVGTDLLEFAKWYATTNYNANPNTFRNPQIFESVVGESEIIPKNDTFETIPKLTTVVTDVIINDTSVPQSITPKIMQKTSETITTTTTQGFKVGSEIKYTNTMKVNLLLVGGVSNSIAVSISAEYNYSSSETETNITEKAWEYNRPVLVLPRTKVTATLSIYSGSFTIPVTLKSTISGNHISNSGYGYALSSIGYTDYNNRSWTDIYRTNFLYDYRNEWPGRKPIYVGRDNIGVKVEGESRVDAELGLYSIVTFKEEPLPGNNLIGNGRTYSMAILRDGSTMDISIPKNNN
ncbi:ETX/MTX2 family pore-forming toxin Cry64Ca [Bacillus thuringiensis]|uniref:Parasporin 5-2 n=1 Tax=Bacillus thuringiensis TaxID=1428 RepID=S5ZYV0_BACTU|nr:ETX/MTX2 family pore-forming toxin Cry64Ca [Bacillus thuringiensis]AGT29560.1 parasporin 5-2 [Bacillus thuringiensis]ARX70227.1 hypothetical protein BVH75_30370 [Bacillus thuringiensis]MEB9697066.1 ETX/MTX2 family pore-forming toxin Cry64Ca [Bacillus cereus]